VRFIVHHDDHRRRSLGARSFSDPGKDSCPMRLGGFENEDGRLWFRRFIGVFVELANDVAF
jgi:hypothetical protein